MKRLIGTAVGGALVLSLGLNVLLYRAARAAPRYVSFHDANTRETYETAHHVREAQRTATGKGIRVGVLDKYFGFGRHRDLYADGRDFADDPEGFEEISEHGFWMATTLKEIAPGVEVYALNVRAADRAREADAIVRALDWAIEHRLNILTYSAEAFRAEQRPEIDAAVRKAIAHGIVTTFVHYPLRENLLPTGFFPAGEGEEERPADLSILHYDYNTLPLALYNRYQRLVEAGERPRSGDDIPYLSISSTSPVAAAFVAMMMEVKGGLVPDEYRRVLIETSRTVEYRGRTVERVVDAPRSLEHLKTRAGSDPASG